MDTRAPQDVLIGRDRECAAIARHAAATRARRGGLVLLAGEAGVGKTSLAQQALAASGLAVLEGRAYQGVTLPYGPLVASLRAYHPHDSDGPELEGLLARVLALAVPDPPTPVASDWPALFP